jgi:hypothetical protein
MKNYYTRFLRSAGDFPCAVSLGGRLPSWELKRWGDRRYKNKVIAPEAALRFTPDGEDDFSVRGGSNTVLYKGRNVSHRWTLLGKDNFEYDVILKKPPESNVISLTLEGAGRFDFFRQPDFVRNPLLRGSYAVYLKDTFIGQGTGKLCHICRPKIIDASGSSVWGDLNIAGDKLFIAIPESWLASAVYPVIVDPVVGLSTAGSHTTWDPWDEGELITLYFEQKFPVNRYLTVQPMSGTYTAYFYCAGNQYENTDKAYPAVYSDLNGFPYQRLTKNESLMNFHTAVNKWVSGSITAKSAISAGSYVWFGAFLLPSWNPAFDYGGKLINTEFYQSSNLPDTYPHYTYLDSDDIIDMRLSMYFQYGTMSENYVRTITQGVCLSDTRAVKSIYKRVIANGVNAAHSTVKSALLFIRRTADAAAVLFYSRRALSARRVIVNGVNAVSSGVKQSLLFFVKITGTVLAAAPLSRRLFAVVRIVTPAAARDFFIKRFMIAGAGIVIKSKITREIVIESRITRGKLK